MATTPNQPNNKNSKRLWLIITAIAACAIVGIIIWKMIAVPQ